MPSVRVRFAPSPTGLLHVGGLRTALYNYLFARKHGGAFLLRIEDTDQERFVDGAEEDIYESLRWAGLDFDEGPPMGGEFGPYRQSERSEIYSEYGRRLVDAGKAYLAFDTADEIDAMRQERQQEGHPAPAYDSTTRMSMRNSLSMDSAEVERRIASGDPYVIRMKVPDGKAVHFEDAIRGSVSFDSTTIDDQVLVKSDGFPTYHLANVIDDHLMGITHVIRGEEWLPSTPKHILLYEAFGWEPPTMAHLPLILSPSGGKLSKRNSEKAGIPVSVRDYRAAGYEPAALLNFLAFLGWNPGSDEEMFTLDELVEAFSLERVGSSGVQFNMDKLNWYNQQYVMRLDSGELAGRAKPALKERGIEPPDDYLRSVAALMQERLAFASDLGTDAEYFFSDPEGYDPKGVEKRWKADSSELVRAYADRLSSLDAFTADSTEGALRNLAEERGVGAGRIIHSVRLAVSGVTFGPGLFEMLELLGKETVVRRLRRAAETLG